jgi:hypothetical protein
LGQTVRLISVPSFSATGIAVLLNLRTLESKAMRFK